MHKVLKLVPQTNEWSLLALKSQKDEQKQQQNYWDVDNQVAYVHDKVYGLVTKSLEVDIKVLEVVEGQLLTNWILKIEVPIDDKW